MSFQTIASKRRFTLPFTVLVAAVALVGCNTFEGAGEDLASAGRGIERAVDGNTDGPYVTQRVNMRAGPGEDFPKVALIKGRERVTVYGCSARRNWCDVNWDGTRGWVSSRYIHYRDGKRHMTINNYEKNAPIQTVSFNFGYWDSHYSARPWYSERASMERRHRVDF
jgi:uncharacterized protein YraI/predicted small secreted protein